MPSDTRAITAALLLLSSSCHPVKPPAPMTLEGPKCHVTASQLRPLIVEWSGMDRTDLEAAMRESMIAVRYQGCELEVLRQCRIPQSRYEWEKTTREEEVIRMEDVDQLYAKMPLAGPTLEAHFKQGNTLKLSTTIIGKHTGTKASIAIDELRASGGDCGRATHLVIGATTGAFEMSTDSRVEAGANMATYAGGETSSARNRLRKSGTSSACNAAKKEDTTPPVDCGSLLRLELAPIKCLDGFKLKDGVGCVEDTSTGNETDALAGDPGDFRLARFIRQAGRTLRDRYMGNKVDDAWRCPGNDDIAQPVTDTKGIGARIGRAPALSFAAMRFVLSAKIEAEHIRLEALAFVLPDGRLKWGVLNRKRTPYGEFAEQGAVKDYADLRVGLERLLGGIKSCQLTLAETSDFQALPMPESLKVELAKETTALPQDFRQWCQAKPETESEWHVTIVSVAAGLVGNGNFGAMGADVAPQDRRFCMKPARLRRK